MSIRKLFTHTLVIFTFALGGCFVNAVAQPTNPPYAISFDAVPNLGKPLIHLERRGTCATCRWYSITVYDSDRVLWHGKDAVRRLGYDIINLRLPRGLEKADKNKTDTETVVAMLRQFGFFDKKVTDSLVANLRDDDLIEISVAGSDVQKTVKFHVSDANEKLQWFIKIIEDFYPSDAAKRLGPVVAADPTIFKVDTDLLSGKCSIGRIITLSHRGQISEYFDSDEFRQKPVISIDMPPELAKEVSQLFASLRTEKPLPALEEHSHRPLSSNSCVRNRNGYLACAHNRDWAAADNEQVLARVRGILTPFYSDLSEKRKAAESRFFAQCR